ncbi:unnamed protein product [Prunus armeniaca]
MGRICILLSIITHVVGSAGGVMILSARVGLVMRFVSYTCRWQCRRVSYGVPSPVGLLIPGRGLNVVGFEHVTGETAKIFSRMSRVFSKWARHRGDVGTKTGSAPVSGEISGRVLSPVARLDTIRALVALAAQKKWKIYQLDVKSAFLNGELEEEIYVEQPQGFIEQGGENKALKLKKALYGLKQAPRAWNSLIDKYFINAGFRRSKSEPTLYTKIQGKSDILIVSLYVDDLICTGNNENIIQEFKKDINQEEDGIFICKKKYTENLLKKFKMYGCKTVAAPLITNEKLRKEDGSSKANESVYRSLIGSLLYLTTTRPDIMYATSLLSRFMQNPSQIHYGAAKRILRYLQGTIDYGIWYKPITDPRLFGYTDSDWAGSVNDMKSTSGYAFTIGLGIFSWSSKKQETVALSSAEAEYVAAASSACQAIWLKRIFEDMGECQIETTEILCDNKSAIAMAKNLVFHSKTKHMPLSTTSYEKSQQTKRLSSSIARQRSKSQTFSLRHFQDQNLNCYEACSE